MVVAELNEKEREELQKRTALETIRKEKVYNKKFNKANKDSDDE